MGEKLRELWLNVGNAAGLDIVNSGLRALTTFSVMGVEQRELKAVLVDSFLEDGYLAGPTVYLSTPHAEEFGTLYVDALAKSFTRLAEYLETGHGQGFTEFNPFSVGFTRLN